MRRLLPAIIIFEGIRTEAGRESHPQAVVVFRQASSGYSKIIVTREQRLLETDCAALVSILSNSRGLSITYNSERAGASQNHIHAQGWASAAWRGTAVAGATARNCGEVQRAWDRVPGVLSSGNGIADREVDRSKSRG